MFCKNCGNEILAGKAFCSKCGARVTINPPQPQQPQEENVGFQNQFDNSGFQNQFGNVDNAVNNSAPVNFDQNNFQEPTQNLGAFQQNQQPFNQPQGFNSYGQVELKPKKSKKKLGIVLGIVVAVLACVGVAGWLLWPQIKMMFLSPAQFYFSSEKITLENIEDEFKVKEEDFGLKGDLDISYQGKYSSYSSYLDKIKFSIDARKKGDKEYASLAATYNSTEKFDCVVKRDGDKLSLSMPSIVANSELIFDIASSPNLKDYFNKTIGLSESDAEELADGIKDALVKSLDANKATKGSGSFNNKNYTTYTFFINSNTLNTFVQEARTLVNKPAFDNLLNKLLEQYKNSNINGSINISSTDIKDEIIKVLDDLQYDADDFDAFNYVVYFDGDTVVSRQVTVERETLSLNTYKESDTYKIEAKCDDDFSCELTCQNNSDKKTITAKYTENELTRFDLTYNYKSIVNQDMHLSLYEKDYDYYSDNYSMEEYANASLKITPSDNKAKLEFNVNVGDDDLKIAITSTLDYTSSPDMSVAKIDESNKTDITKFAEKFEEAIKSKVNTIFSGIYKDRYSYSYY